ncbi:MAG: YolD-like family protein [Firmicutes bacterium]|jgi:hypothetical protein|nr:YolD-like family protein [Bacillota bacterium]
MSKDVLQRNKDIHSYDDIIDMPHPTSKKHPRMSLYNRAAQFSPFAALTDHKAVMAETRRLTQERKALDESEKELLNEKLRLIEDAMENVGLGPKEEVSFTYFIPDEKKTGGAYVSIHGMVKKIDRYRGAIIMEDERVIPIEEIIAIEGQGLEWME